MRRDVASSGVAESELPKQLGVHWTYSAAGEPGSEDADAGFLPSLGIVSHVSEPSGPGVRVDSSLFEGMEVGPNYDSLVSKLVVWGADRTQALARLRRARSSRARG